MFAAAVGVIYRKMIWDLYREAFNKPIFRDTLEVYRFDADLVFFPLWNLTSPLPAGRIRWGC